MNKILIYIIVIFITTTIARDNPLQTNNRHHNKTISNVVNQNSVNQNVALGISDTGSISQSRSPSETLPNEFVARDSQSVDKANQYMCFRSLNGSYVQLKTGTIPNVRLGFLFIYNITKNPSRKISNFIGLRHTEAYLSKDERTGRENRYYFSGNTATGKYEVRIMQEPFRDACNNFSIPLKYIYLERYFTNPLISVCARKCKTTEPLWDPFPACDRQLDETPLPAFGKPSSRSFDYYPDALQGNRKKGNI